MLNFLSEQFSTLLVGSVVLLLLLLVINKMIKDKKTGKSCGCGCSGCASSESCHPKK